MPNLPAPPWRRFALRLILAILVLCAAAAGVRLLSGVIPDQLEMTLAGALALLVPGWALASVLSLDDDYGPVTAWGLVPLLGVMVWIVPGGVGLIVGLPFVVVCGVVVVVTAIFLAVRPPLAFPPLVDSVTMSVLGVLGALFAWQWQSVLIGDALFHAGVIRKILVLPRPDERNIWQFQNGYPHAGYAFPLLHLPQALAIKIANLDVSIGYVALAPLFGLMGPVVAYAVGNRIAGRLAGVITALITLWISITGTLIISTGQQPRYYVTMVVIPAVILLVLEQVRRPSVVIEGLLVTGVLVVTFCHLTYGPPLWASLIVVAILNPQLRRVTAAAIGVSIAMIAAVWIVAVHGSTPSKAVRIHGTSFWALDGKRIALSGRQVLNHRGENVMALIAVIWGIRKPREPLGIVAVMAAVMYLICTIPGLTPGIGVIVGEGQSQRYWEMIPWPYVLGPAIVLAARSRIMVILIAAAAVASVVLARTNVLITDAATVISSIGALVLIVVAVHAIVRSRRRRRPSHERHDSDMLAPLLAIGLAVAVMIGSVTVYQSTVRDNLTAGRPQPDTYDTPTPEVIDFFRSLPGPPPVVLSQFRARYVNWFSGLAYQLVGQAPVYAAAISSFHSQSERKDDPRERRKDVTRFLTGGTSVEERHRILRRWNVDYVAVDLKTARKGVVSDLNADPALEFVYQDPVQLSDDRAQIRIYKVNQAKLGG